MTTRILGAATLAFALLGATPALAQAADAMTADALILKPLTLTNLEDLDFGTIIPSGSGQTVKINANTGARTSTYPAGLSPTNIGHRARFASSGLNNQMVVLELSEPGDLLNAENEILELSALQLDTGGVIRTLTPESQVFFVGIGGTVFVSATQAEGDYVGTFSLTATYL